MSRLMTANFPESYKPGLRKLHFMTIKNQPQQYRQWANVIDGADVGGEAGKAYFEDLQVSSFGRMAWKPEGDPIEFDTPVEGDLVRFTPATSALGFRFTMEAKQDQKYGLLDKIVADFGYVSIQQIEYNAHRIFNEGTSTTGGNGFTAAGFQNEALFSTSHALLRGGTGSNRLATDMDLSQTAVELASDVLRGTLDDSGNPMPITSDMLLLVPFQSRWIAKEITESELKPYTANNEINALKGEFQFMESYWLTDPDSWFLIPKDKSRHSLTFWLRMKPDLIFDEDYNTRDTVITSVMRTASGHTSWRGPVGSYGAA